jgi:hypothetical protein
MCGLIGFIDKDNVVDWTNVLSSTAQIPRHRAAAFVQTKLADIVGILITCTTLLLAISPDDHLICNCKSCSVERVIQTASHSMMIMLAGI